MLALPPRRWLAREVHSNSVQVVAPTSGLVSRRFLSFQVPTKKSKSPEPSRPAAGCSATAGRVAIGAFGRSPVAGQARASEERRTTTSSGRRAERMGVVLAVLNWSEQRPLSGDRSRPDFGPAGAVLESLDFLISVYVYTAPDEA